MLNIKNIGFIVLLGLSIQLSAQSVIQIEKRAFEAFKLAQYTTAKVDFQQLLARDPESDSYNFHYAVCVFHTENKQHAKKYFEFVANRSVSFCEAHYYLGKIHNLGYRFDLAISSFKAYLSCNPADYLHANREISFCNNGKSLLEHPKSLSTLGVQLASEETFFQKYDLEAIGGTIYPDPSLQTKIDKKKNYIPTCYYKRGDTFKFYASYGDEATSLKLFYIQRISQDVWSKPTAIPLVWPDSELKYPFFDAASKQLYFSSNGFTSMGGYDLFRVSYDPALNEVGTPENMDFPFSSAADDYFFVPLNATATTAWFASNRNTATGAIESMQVSYTINAQPLVAIVGDFSDFVDPKNKGIQISVTDKADGITYGPFTSDELGSYKLMLPGAGTYVFNATIEGTDKVFQHEQKIPQQKENVVFKQTINYSMNQGTESADFSHEFNAVQSEEMKAFKANAIAQLSLKAHSKPLVVDVVEPMNTENTVVQQLESLSIKGNTLLEKSEYLMDKLLEISNTGFDLSDAAERIKNQINSTNARLDAYQKQADMYKKLLSETDTVANQRFAAALMKLNDSIQKYELELASWSLAERENQVKLSTWNTLNVEPSITSLSERIHMALIQENQDSLIAVLQRNSNSINQFITYSANLENTSIPIIASNEPLLEELKQLEATEKQLSQQIAQIEQQKITANRKELGALNTDQDAKEQMLNSTRLVIASKMGDITRNDIVNALKINGHEPTDSLVEQLLDRTTARKTEQTSLQRVVSAQSSNTTSLDHQRSVMQAETTVIQNQMLLASPIEKEALANKLQELEASLDSINTEMLALVNTKITNPVQSNKAAPGTNTTNPVTNERSANDVAVNPAETNTTAPATNTTNSVTNERRANDVAVNPAESVAVPVQRLKTEEQQKTENAINEVQELQTELSSLQPEQGELDNSMSLLKNQLRIAKVLLALKTTYGDSTYALIIGEKQGKMLAEALSGSIADLSENSRIKTQFSDNAAEIITNGLVVKELPVKTQPFTPNPLLELTPQQRTKLGSDKSYDDYISLRKEFVSLASKRNEIEMQLAQKRVALFRAVDDGAIEAISEEMVELANMLNMLEAQELRILSRIERIEDREAYHVLASQGIAPSQNLVYAPLDAQSLNFTLNVDKKQGNRYPILSTLPEGLIFRIQVGVFRNAVPDYFFREFSPVSGERLTDELTAYLTGFFVNSVQANDARGQVRGLGYTDAFVVAYCDGKRIPIKQALEYEKKGLCTIRNQGEVLSEASALLNSKEESIPSTVNIPKEVYYTIQVAALKNQDNGKLKNVPALFYIQSKTGLYKYNSGKFKQLNEAKQQRDALKTLGYTDAYIVAYRDGIAVNFKEIEIALAYEQESENRASPTKIAVNTDLSGIELIDPTNVFYAFSKSVDTLLLEQMNAYNRMEAFVYTPDVIRSAPLDANDISPLLAIYYSDFTLSEVNPERVEKMSIQDNSNTFPMVHDFAIRNQIPFRVSYSNEARPYIDFYPVSEANRESIRKLAEALSLNVILN